MSIHLVTNSRTVVENVTLDSDIRTFYTNVNNKWKDINKSYQLSEDIGMLFSARAIEQQDLEDATNQTKTLIDDFSSSLSATSEGLEKEWNKALEIEEDKGLIQIRDRLVEQVNHLNQALSSLTNAWLTQATFVVRKKAEKAVTQAFDPINESINNINNMHDTLVALRSERIIAEENKIVVQSTILATSIFIVVIIVSLLMLRKLKKTYILSCQ